MSLRGHFLFQYMSPISTWFMCNIHIWNYASSNSIILVKAACFVSSGSSQRSGRKVDLTDHPWVMMMRGLLLLKPQEVRVCSCTGSSAQLSSPSNNSLKTELLTCGSFISRTPLCSVSTTPRKPNSRRVVCLSFMITLHIRTWCDTGYVYFEVNNYK